MNPEEYIIIKKSDLQEFVNKITLDNKELPEFISGIYALNNYINSKISKPLQPLLEETFEKARDKTQEERLAKEIDYQEKIKDASFDYANIIVDGIFDLELIS